MEDGTRQPIFSVRLHPSESSLVLGYAARILWFDLDTKVPLRTLSQACHKGNVLGIEVAANFVFSIGSNEK